MKYVKMLGLAAVAAMALMAFVGAGTASATTLTGVGGSILKSGSTITATNEGTVTLTTSFKNIECTHSEVSGKTTNETGTAVEGKVEVLTFDGVCNCEVKVLKKGTLSITWISGSNGTLKSSGAEVTASCSSIFGNVHCIYATNGTDLGTLTGSGTTKSTATMDIASADIPRLPTSGLCDESANWDAKYEVNSPDELNVTS